MLGNNSYIILKRYKQWKSHCASTGNDIYWKTVVEWTFRSLCNHSSFWGTLRLTHGLLTSLWTSLRKFQYCPGRGCPIPAPHPSPEPGWVSTWRSTMTGVCVFLIRHYFLFPSGFRTLMDGEALRMWVQGQRCWLSKCQFLFQREGRQELKVQRGRACGHGNWFGD